MFLSMFKFLPLFLLIALLSGCSKAVDQATPNDANSPVTTASPPGGIYNSDQSVTLSCNDGNNGAGCGSISYYMVTNGVSSGTFQYAAKTIGITETTTLYYFSTDRLGNSEALKSESYLIDKISPVSSASPSGGTYSPGQPVKLSCDDANGSGCDSIHYTTDNSIPNLQSPVYSTDIILNNSTTLRYLAVDKAGNTTAGQDNYSIVDISAPVINSTVSGDGQITIDWAPATNASGYNVYYGTDPAVDQVSGTKLDVYNNTSAKITGLQNNTVYYFRVAGYVTGLEGPLSQGMSDFPYKPYASMNWLYPLTSGHSLSDVEWIGNQYIAVGTRGRILTSPDGSNWTMRDSGSTGDLASIAGSGNRLVAVGSKGTVLISTDATGTSWKSIATTVPTTTGFYSVLWNGTQFVVLGTSSTILFMDEDGTNQSTPAMVVNGVQPINDFTWTGTKYFAAGGKVIYESADAITWDINSDYSTDVDVWMGGIRYLNGKIMVYGRITLAYSASGSAGTWTMWKKPDPDPFRNTYQENIVDIAYTGGRYLILYTDTDLNVPNTILTSTDLSAWTTTTADFNFHSVSARPSGEFVVVGSSGEILSASNAATPVITNVTNIGSQFDFTDIASNGVNTVAVGWDNLAQSGNGASWTLVDNNSLDPKIVSSLLGDVKWMNDKFVAVGSSGVIATSADGKNWVLRQSAILTLNSSSWNMMPSNPLYIAVGSSGTVLTSGDGTIWVSEDSGSTVSLNDITWDGNQFVAVGGTNSYLTRDSSGVWTEHTIALAKYGLNSIASNGKVILVGGQDGVYRSADKGVTWEKISYSGVSYIWTGAVFAAVTAPYPGIPTLTISPDGYHYKEQAFPDVDAIPTGLAPAGNKFYVAADNGGVLEIVP